jgi:hypothetical protein
MTAHHAPAALVAFYPFEGSADDASGNGLDGTISMAVLTSAGYQGQAFQFDGTDSFISIPIDINPAQIPEITMGAWVNSDTTSGVRAIISHDNGGFDRTLNMDTRGGGGNRYSAFKGSGVVAAGPAPVPTGEWVFVAVRYSSTEGKVALNVGADQVSSTGSPGTGNTTTFIGKNPGYGELFMGRIDNVFLYDEWLSDDQIEAIRQGGAGAILQKPVITAMRILPDQKLQLDFLSFATTNPVTFHLEATAPLGGTWENLPATYQDLGNNRHRFTFPINPTTSSLFLHVLQAVVDNP